MMDTPPDSHDDRRQRPVRVSRGGGGAGHHARNNSSAANVGQGLRPPSPPLEKHQLQDEPYISPDSDLSDDDSVPPISKIPQQPPAVPDSPSSRRSPGKSRPPVANAGQRDSWGPPQPPPQARPTSMSADDGRRHSGSHNANGASRYRRHEQMNGRPHSGQPSSSGTYPKNHRSDLPPGRSAPPQNASRRPNAVAVDARHRVPSPSSPVSPTKSHHINRLESPGIMDSVLQPLKQKLTEYERSMNQSQTEMAQLDDELRALQEKRRQTEDRYLDAKDKHDEYERQYEDVERAMKGELQQGGGAGAGGGGMSHAPLYAPQMMATSGPVQRPATMESYGGGGERRPTSNPVSNRSSRTRQLGRMDRLKLRFMGN